MILNALTVLFLILLSPILCTLYVIKYGKNCSLKFKWKLVKEYFDFSILNEI